MFPRNVMSSVKKYPQHSYNQLSVLKFYHHPHQKQIEAPLREPITQWQHALQAANNMKTLLQQQKQPRTSNKQLVVAAALHDIGHFVCNKPTKECVDVCTGKDDFHEIAGADYLASLGFPRTVTEPIRFHGVAKIWLCDKLPQSDYYESLTIASKLSLEMQRRNSSVLYGQFLRSEFMRDAILLRRCDDMSKKKKQKEYLYYKNIDDVLKLMYEVLFKI